MKLRTFFAYLLFQQLKSSFSEEVGEEKYKYPIPVVENVYKAWKPVNYGHPLRDPTVIYAPPSLDRVKFERNRSRQNRGRAESSRSSDVNESQPRSSVIFAQPSKKHLNLPEYSIYGSPDINYSHLYEARGSSDYLAASRDVAALQNEYSEFYHDNKKKEDILKGSVERSQRRMSHGGGFQYVSSPSKQNVFSDDSLYYISKLSIHPKSLRQNNHESSRSSSQLNKSSSSSSYIYNSPNSQYSSSAVIYSFRNKSGQKRNVGVVYDDVGGPQVSNVFSSQKNMLLNPHVINQNIKNYNNNKEEEEEEYEDERHSLRRTIPIQGSPPTLAPRIKELTHQEIVSGNLNHVYHGLQYQNLDELSSFPLGSPQESLQILRPSSFPVINRPPLFKELGHKLQGSFGPPLPSLSPSIPLTKEKNDKRRLVFKTERDMDIVEPDVIYRVKDSGELINSKDEPLAKETNLYDLCLRSIPEVNHIAVCSPLWNALHGPLNYSKMPLEDNSSLLTTEASVTTTITNNNDFFEKRNSIDSIFSGIPLIRAKATQRKSLVDVTNSSLLLSENFSNNATLSSTSEEIRN